MADTIKLNIITPERKAYEGEVIDLTTENDIGRLEILPNHVPMVTSIVPTVTTFTTVDGKKLKLFTSTGVLKIEKNELDLLSEDVEWPQEIDVQRAEEAKKKAEQLLREKENIDYKRAELKLKRALARLRTKD
ncbi:F0F1 ATP synthase subunit epsilon [Candidatus Clostridium radicumherbarum]|uniref:ATP synthase epsilon chain n=1 Tax=Candidatus Clostridium radicumherbarum TaxID=3381662 RepID=A0ABW8TWK7_9CLOT